MNNKPQQAIAKRDPDCVTKVRMGNTVLTVSGFFKQSGAETAMDKMVKAIKADADMREQVSV